MLLNFTTIQPGHIVVINGVNKTIKFKKKGWFIDKHSTQFETENGFKFCCYNTQYLEVYFPDTKK